MNINTITLDQPAGATASNAPRGGNSVNGDSSGNGSFQVAYARVLSDSEVPATRDTAPTHPSRGQHGPAPPSDAAHTVRAGETLYGIVRTRLAAMGVESNAKASMQGVTQLAQANHIANPDRIYVGQKLDFGALQSAFGQPIALADGGIDAPTISDSAIEQLQQQHWEASVPQADAQITATVAAALPPTIDALSPTVARDDAAEASRVDAVAVAVIDASARTPLAMRQIALYEQDRSIALAKPTEAVRALPDIIYKGVVGKVLDAMPLESSTRTGLQQASAVVSSTASAHALGVLTGFGGPLLTVAGLIWGIFSARQINAAATADAKAIGAPTPVGDLQLASAAMQTSRNNRIDARN